MQLFCLNDVPMLCLSCTPRLRHFFMNQSILVNENVDINVIELQQKPNKTRSQIAT